MLCAVPLHSLLDWLFEPQGPNLVETSATVAPFKALAIAVTKRMLYEEKPPLVGVGQAEEEVSKEAGTSQPEVPAHGEPPGIQVGGGGKSLPTKTVPDRE